MEKRTVISGDSIIKQKIIMKDFLPAFRQYVSEVQSLVVFSSIIPSLTFCLKNTEGYVLKLAPAVIHTALFSRANLKRSNLLICWLDSPQIACFKEVALASHARFFVTSNSGSLVTLVLLVISVQFSISIPCPSYSSAVCFLHCVQCIRAHPDMSFSPPGTQATGNKSGELIMRV